ncbi:MAG: NOL1/NOP2/sun family putative RNA methylase [Bacillota bacterium]|nr:NOL1/NOP2/sun family putative RNA methylase [Bacillota bacterium]
MIAKGVLLSAFERYRGLIDDWEAFAETVARPQPDALRANRLRVAPAELRARLEARGFRLRPYPWAPEVMRVESGPCPPGSTFEHWLGLFYLQEAAAALPVVALDPQPGERILDLSAAPGGKTTQIAERVGPAGLVVANEADPARAGWLLANLGRMGVTSVVTTVTDGRRFPGGLAFDRVLVDAPCSGEGNLRRDSQARKPVRPGRRQHLASLQEALLRRALELVRPGGVVVYSTCTFAPEEDEAVLDAVLRAARGAVEAEELPAGLPGVEGAGSWEGVDFLPQVRRARRLYPHHLDSGGMFLARLRRLGSLPWSGGGSSPDGGPDRALPEERPDEAAAAEIGEWLEERFGIPVAALRGLHVYRRGVRTWLSSSPQLPAWPERWTAGLPLARWTGRHWWPSGFALHRLGGLASRQWAELDRERLRELLEGRGLSPEASGVTRPREVPLERGLVILRTGGAGLGLGRYDGHLLHASLARERAKQLLSCLVQQGGMPERADPGLA